ncbi:hypothetical protein GCM10022198_23740 [Klugiella xanthotipulae]|uniref:Uncharacterized protein n=1 Tax=Klugiella xanthotipulae TaxID=244735 RepID=A0A543I6J1_9MICO|nr:hypothetical protein [Klugiella xanthotipulae]TQM66179.1 hypothetical protein FB466_1009 [Klugiella xanthotipulae]
MAAGLSGIHLLIIIGAFLAFGVPLIYNVRRSIRRWKARFHGTDPDARPAAPASPAKPPARRWYRRASNE